MSCRCEVVEVCMRASPRCFRPPLKRVTEMLFLEPTYRPSSRTIGYKSPDLVACVSLN